eukprot:GFYU01026650.1.p1 GENE.GFYU01026650.1~~GFYU01026650.1.p1  ORF type:complete len:129 (+),score=18.49 GFYU01026650.1:179-565(+)
MKHRNSNKSKLKTKAAATSKGKSCERHTWSSRKRHELIEELSLNVQVSKFNHGEGHLETLGFMDALAEVYNSRGQLYKAEALFQRCYKVRLETFGRCNWGTLLSKQKWLGVLDVINCMELPQDACVTN